jgi:excisionase family DNA binding protein
MKQSSKVEPQTKAFRTSEAAAYLDISRATLYRLMEAGQIPYFLIGKRRFISRSALDRILEGETVRE